MIAKASSKHVRMSPRKARLVAALIKNRPADEAVDILENLDKKSGRLMLAILKSGIANAVNKKMEAGKLWVSEARIDVGPTFKRIQPRSMGRADVIHKRTSHVTIELAERTPAAGE